MRQCWAVYCKDGHGAIGPFDTELEALECAMGMMDDERKLYGNTPCLYDAIPLVLDDNKPMPKVDTIEPRGGMYL